jgi:hypothetical protein
MKVVVGVLAGALSFVSQLGLPAPWGPLVSALMATVAYVANHDAIAAKLKGA